MEIASYGSVRDSEICRTCLLEVVDDSKIFYLDSQLSTGDKTTIRHKLHDCIPELDLNVTPNAAVCSECLSSINSAHTFKKKCLQTEKNINKFARRMGTIFVDLGQLVEHNKKSLQYPDIDHIQIKLEPGISESHAYTRFFVKQEPLETPESVSDDDDVYQSSFDTDYSLDYSAEIKQELANPESHTVHNEQPKILASNMVKNVMVKYQPIEPEPIKKGANIKLIVPPNNIAYNIQQKYTVQQTNSPMHKKIKRANHVPSTVTAVENLKVDIKEKLLGNCAISLKEIPKNKNNNILPLNSKIIECKLESKNINNGEVKSLKSEVANEQQIKKSETHLNTFDESQIKLVPIKKPRTKSLTYSKLQEKLELSKKLHHKSSVLNNAHNIRMKSGSPNMVYAILRLVKPQNQLSEKPHNVQTSIETSKPIVESASVPQAFKIQTKLEISEPVQMPDPQIEKVMILPLNVKTKSEVLDNASIPLTEEIPPLISYNVQGSNQVSDFAKPEIATKLPIALPHNEQIKLENLELENLETVVVPSSLPNNVLSSEVEKSNVEAALPVVVKTEPISFDGLDIAKPIMQPPLPILALAQISEPPKLVKIEHKPVLASHNETDDTMSKFGYNININDIPPLVPIQSDNLTNFDDGITHLECTPNIADYVHDELDDDDSPHKCNDCEFECKGKSEFIIHLNTHMEEKFDIKSEPLVKKRDLYGRIKTLGGKLVYECQICNYRTGLKRRHIVHAKLHEENKLLKCTLCNYLCATKSNLNVHMAVHTGHKPHKCTECGYGTVSKSALIVHTRIHTGDRPYSCGVCGYCTISKSALIVHNRIHTGSKPYRCPTCNYRTITKSALTVHMRTHSGDKPFKCHLCEYSTRAKSALNVHVRIHEGYKPYQCTECEYRCSQRSGLNVHMRVHTGDKPFQCTECEYKCSNKSSLVVHYRTHTGETPYKCELCDYTTAWKSALNVHRRIHGDNKPFRCTECEYKCAQRSTLNVHMRIHTGDKPYQCLECDYRCRYQGNLKMHMRVHTRETPFKCSLCNYSTTAKSALIVHFRIHTGEKPFKCTECSYKCSTKSSLKIHNRVHTGETPYECKRCLYKASSNSALKVHLRIHTGEKPFKCSYCSYRASNKGSIKVHLRVHTGETPYECSICDYKTTAKSALIVHMRIHTGDKPYKCEECSYRCNNRSSLKVHLKVHTGRTPYRCEICDYRCKKKFVLKRHLRVHREKELGEANEDEPNTPETLITIKNEIDESSNEEDVDNEDDLINDDEEIDDDKITNYGDVIDEEEITKKVAGIKEEDVEGEVTNGNEIIHEEDVVNLGDSGYKADLDVSNIQPEYAVIAV